MRVLARSILAISITLAFLGIESHTLRAEAATGNVLYSPNVTLYPNEDASYPRVIRLAHSGSANGTVLSTFSHSGTGQPSNFPVYQSNDGGTTWSTSPISVIAAAEQGWDLDQPALFELPQPAGPYPAGTLLAAGIAWVRGDFSRQALEVFRSADQGHSWTYMSTCTTQSGQPTTGGHGFWEPDIQVDSAGNVVCYFSDERQASAGYNQLLGHVVSTDGGQTWGSEVYDVAVRDNVQRPGMATVIKLPNGQYMMSFEECQNFPGDEECSVHVKTSMDGDNWGPTDSLGSLVQTSDGRHLLHTPYITWSPAGGPNGTLIVSGQRLVTGPDGSITVLPESGRTLLINTNLGSGYWFELPAPFVVDPTGGYDAGAGETSCPAYSAPLLPSHTGTSILYMAGTRVSTGNCEVRYGVATAGALPFYAPFAGGTDAGWTTYGGSWSIANGVYSDSVSGPGDKSVAGSTGWADYTLQGDVKLTSAGQAGLLLRVTNPSTGANALNGYFVGIETAGVGNVFLGRVSGGWTGLQSAPMPGGVTSNTWYHMTVQAVGCTFTVSAQPVGSASPPTAFSYTDAGCSFRSGQIGVRDYSTTAAWRNITVTPGGTTTTAVTPYGAPFASGTATGWTIFGGNWTDSATDETYSDSTGGAGDKAVTGSTSWTNYTLQGDVELTSAGTNANAGLLVRVTNPSVGADAVTGYYAGLDTTGDLVVGRLNYGWTYLGGSAVPGGVTVNTWYHMVVQVVGCTLNVSAQAVSSTDQATFSYTDTGCTQTAGQIGVRTYYAGAAWRYLAMSPQ